MTEPQRIVCRLSNKPLFADVDRDGNVIGITNGGAHPVAPEGETYQNGKRRLPLYGDDLPFDPVTDVVETSYKVEADRVIRTETVRDKTAAELMQEISWWFAALNRPHEAKGMSPADVNDAARRQMGA